MYAIKNATIYDFENYNTEMYIIFDKQIIEVGKMINYIKKDYDEIDATGKIVMPGLINGHSHIYSTFARGMNVSFDPKNFKELLEQLWWKLDRNITNDITYYSGIVSGVEYLKNGVTTIIDHHASGEILNSLNSLKQAVCNEVKLRGVFCFETSDRFPIKTCIDENISFINENNTSSTKGLFGMHASFTLSDESLREVSKNLAGNPIHIHVAESKYDQEHSINHYGERVINRLNRHDLINRNSIITHGLYLDDNELDIIKQKQAVVALNVSSNMNNAVGLPDYNKLKSKGIKVIIGNDGISQRMTNEYQRLYFAMHHQSVSPTAFGFSDLINIINNTYIYASDILDVNLGKIKAGFEADLLMIPYIAPTPLNSENIFGHLLFGLFNNFNPETVFVEGIKIMDKYQVESTLEDKYKQASELAKILWDRIKEEDER